MNVKSHMLSGVLLLCALLLLSSCSTVRLTQRTDRPGIGNGPPAHAPAHGHRRKAEKSTTVVIESSDIVADAYVVEGKN